MRPMISKYGHGLLSTGIILVLLAAAVWVAAAIVLPTYLESKLLPRLGKEFGLIPGDVHIRRIGLWGADLGPIRLLSNDVPVITIVAVQIDYSPLSLAHGKVKGIAIGGLGLRLSLTPQGIFIAGRPLRSVNSASPTSGEAEFDLKTLLPVELDRFSIYQSHLIIHRNQHRHVVPFEIRLQTQNLSKGLLKGRAELSIFGNPLSLDAAIDQSANHANLSIATQDFLLESLSQLKQMPAHVQVAGRADLNGKASFTLQPLELTSLSIASHFENTHFTTPKGTIENLASNQEDTQPIVLSIKGDSPAKIQWSCSPFGISSLLNLQVHGFKGEVSYTNKGWSLNSVINTLIPKQRLSKSGHIETDSAIEWQITARGGNSEKGLEFDLISQKGGAFAATMEGRRLTGQKHEININGHLRHSTLHAEGKFSAADLSVQLPEGKTTAPLLNINGTLTLQPEDSDVPSSMRARAILSEVRTKLGATAVHIPKISLEASGEGKPWHYKARFKLSNGLIIDQPNRLRIKNLTMELPLKWPDPSVSENGRVKIDAIQWNNRQMGGLKGTLRQTSHGLTMALHHTSKLFPGMRVLINGWVDTSSARISTEIPPHDLADEIDLGRFHPAGAGMRVTGSLKAFGELTADGTGTRGSGQLKFSKGRLSDETRAFLLEGIDMDIQIKDIFEMKSAPQQRLHVDNLAFGSLKADHLDVDFQIEGWQTLFIEKAGINWSNGKINTSSIRIKTDKEDYDVTLFCDRLNLAMVLEQLGAAQASGEGTVSGRIPLRWAGGRLSFDNGFLFSTPGQSGSIQLTGTQMLLSGLPPETPQHTQLDIATEALKDYTYKWAKLNVKSEEDILLLKLQFDGKPNQLLPFAYDQSLGQFKRVAGKGQADFKGISIDLNLRSPLNDIINYKELLKQ